MDDDIEIEIDSSGREFAHGTEFGVGPTADASEDQMMEEGELSDNEDLRHTHLGGIGRGRKNIQDRLGPRVNFSATAGDSYDMSQKILPDLVMQLGASGVTHDPDFAQKKEARAKRFQLEGQLPEPSYNDVQQMYDSLEVPKDQRDPENTDKLHRFETIHITGFSTKVQTADLGEYFKDFNPVSCEWCDGKSANIVWGLDASAAKAMCYLSRPIGQTEDNQMENDAPNGANKKDSLLQHFENTQFNDSIDTKEFGIKDAPPGGPWRIGKPSNLENWKDTTSIFMRLSRTNDAKPLLQDKDLNKRNYELRREGGIWSSSKKQKIREAMALDQQMHEEHERSKKYTPGATWQDIAEDWSNTKKKENDFSDDLRLLANQLRRKGKNVPIGDEIPVTPRSPVKDWDAPEFEEENPEAYEVPQAIRRKRRLIARDGSISPPARTMRYEEAEEEDPWKKKSKIPKMAMYADAEEDKLSAKDRIFSSIKRKIPNKPQVEIYEEDVEDDAFEDDHVDMRQRLNFKNMSFQVKGKMDDTSVDARSRLNDRFKLPANLKSRLGHKEYEEQQQQYYDSGDSLERDTGADLGDTTEKMVIQVTQSDGDEESEKKPVKAKRDHHRRRNEDRNEAMEEDGDDEETNNDVDHRKRAPPKDLRSKISSEVMRGKVSSEVVQIKTEKGEEERMRLAARRRRENEANQAREEKAEADREARRRQRSERRPDDRDQEERRRRREHERRNNDSRAVNRPEKSDLQNRRDSDRNRDRNRDRDQRNDRDEKRKEVDRKKEQPRKQIIKIKKEKMSDDSSSDSDSSSSSSDSDSSSSSSSDSSSSDSSSDSDSSSSSSGSDRNRKKKKTGSKVASGSSRPKSRQKDESNRKGKSDESNRKKSSKDKSSGRSDKDNVKNKLQEYLAKAKERRRKDGK